jgi:hypothetical protein
MKIRIKASLKQAVNGTAEEDKNGAYKLHSKVVMDGITYEVIKKHQEFGRFGPEFVYDLKDPEGVIVKNVGHKEIRASLKQIDKKAGPWVSEFSEKLLKRYLREFETGRLDAISALRRILQSPVPRDSSELRELKNQIEAIWKKVAPKLDFITLTMSRPSHTAEDVKLAEKVMQALLTEFTGEERISREASESETTSGATYSFDSYIESRRFNRKVYEKAAKNACRLIDERFGTKGANVELIYGMSAKYQTPYCRIKSSENNAWDIADLVAEAFEKYFSSVSVEEDSMGEPKVTFQD